MAWHGMAWLNHASRVRVNRTSCEARRNQALKSNMDMFQKAIEAQYRYCHRKGLIFDQPSTTDSTITDDLIVLANVRGEIARFKIGRNNRLRRQ